MARNVILLILDGWGIGPKDDSNPIYAAHPEHFAWLEEHFPVTSLEAAGIHVGLPWGETGNSEVGHLTLGAGKIIYQHYPRISLSIRDGSFFKNPALLEAAKHARANGGRLHFAGLLTKANTHASMEHLLALIKFAEGEKLDYFLHLFGDAIDSSPRAILELLPMLPENRIASLTGRYYAMDREENWQLTKAAYDAMTGAGGVVGKTPKETAEATLARNLSEEFIPATRFMPEGAVRPNDALVFFNFREDSIRQLAGSFIAPATAGFPTEQIPSLYIATFTQYLDSFGCPVAYPPVYVTNCLGETISSAGKSQLRLAESYKYAHVTYFFNGYHEEPYKNEYRVLVPSLQNPHPEEHPELSLTEVTDRLIQSIDSRGFDFILTNFANGDTIGHTGNYDAAIAAVKAVDKELGRVLQAVARTDGVLLITADHGNIERMYNPSSGRPETQHDPNPVPLYLVGKDFKGRRFMNWQNLAHETAGNLSDVAPTVLELMGISRPEEMNPETLLKSLL